MKSGGWDPPPGHEEASRVWSGPGGTDVHGLEAVSPDKRAEPRLCSGPPWGFQTPGLTPHAAVTDGNSWGEGGGQASCLWERGGERGVPLGSGQLAVVSWGAPGAGCGEPQTDCRSGGAG